MALRRSLRRFNIMFPWVPGGLDEFVDRVVPELQREAVSARNGEERCGKISACAPRNRFFREISAATPPRWRLANSDSVAIRDARGKPLASGPWSFINDDAPSPADVATGSHRRGGRTAPTTRSLRSRSFTGRPRPPDRGSRPAATATAPAHEAPSRRHDPVTDNSAAWIAIGRCDTWASKSQGPRCRSS
jgi:hypothetical protein